MKLEGEYTCDPNKFQLTDAMLESYRRLGYFLIRGFLSSEELTKLKFAVENERFMKYASQILGGEVYHYHTKLMMKAARTGGEHIWHQDYGYWYKNGCLFPEQMISVFIPVDRCVEDSGCLQILTGSHECGRIDHSMKAGQTGADVDRVQELKAVCPHAFVEMDAGDALFFHANLIHCSGHNVSASKRWALIPSYNRKSNNPVYEHHHPQYTPLEQVPDSSILSCDNFDDLSGKQFNHPSEDKTAGHKAL